MAYANGGAGGKHGWDYQVNVAILCYHRGYHRGYSFEMKTEVEMNGKFDDMEFKFNRNDANGRLLLQVKFKEQEGALIRYKTLIDQGQKAKKDPKKSKDKSFNLNKSFNLKTYFESFKNMKNFDKDDTLCIYTNIGFDDNLLSSSVEEVSENQEMYVKELLGVNISEDKKCPKFYKLKYSDRFQEDLMISNLDLPTFLVFLNKLIFAVNQPNSKQINDLVEDELNEKYNLTNSSEIFKKLSADFSEYISHPSGKCKSDEDAKKYFESVQSRLSSMNLLGIQVLNEEKQILANYDFFNDVSTLKTTLNTEETLIHITSKSTSMSFIKVVQFYKNEMNDSTFKFGFAATDIKTLLKYDEKCKSSFKNLASFYLVVEIRPLEKEELQAALNLLKDLISEVYRSTHQKKLVLISVDEDKICWSALRGKAYEYFGDKCLFKDFKNNIREQIMEKLVIEVGEELLLKTAESLWKSTHFLDNDKSG